MTSKFVVVGNFKQLWVYDSKGFFCFYFWCVCGASAGDGGGGGGLGQRGEPSITRGGGGGGVEGGA